MPTTSDIYIDRIGPSLEEYTVRLTRVAERRLTWWERQFSDLRKLDPGKAAKCLQFLPEVHRHVTATNLFGKVEIYLCYGQWDMAVEALESALATNSDQPIAHQDRAMVWSLVDRMKSG